MIKNFLLILTIISLGIYCSKGIIRNYVFYTHDGDFHIARSYEAVEALNEGHFPLRWAGGLNYNCGIPVFTFFYPLIYYLVFLTNFFVNDIINSLRIIQISTFILGPVFFYLWIHKETNNRLSAFLSALLYLFLPYRFLLIYVRGSPEYLIYAILPAFFYLSRLYLSKGRVITGFLISVIIALAITAHHVVFFVFSPVIIFYLYLVGYLKITFPIKELFFRIFILLAGLGLSAFFWFPAIFEKSNTKLGIIDFFAFKDHFPVLSQLIKSPWGFGFSMAGINDGLSLMIGYAQLSVLIMAIALITGIFLKRSNFRLIIQPNKTFFFWLTISLIFIFMTLESSLPIWKFFPALMVIQYPWRLLGVIGFCLSALGGILVSSFKKSKIALSLLILFIALSIYGTRNHLFVSPATNGYDYQNFDTNHPLRRSTTTYANEILNNKSLEQCSFYEQFLIDQRGHWFNPKISRGNTYGQVIFKSLVSQQSSLRLNLEYFPQRYIFRVNNLKTEYHNCQGRICLNNVNLVIGDNLINWRIQQTRIEIIANILSLAFLGIWLIILYRGKKDE